MSEMWKEVPEIPCIEASTIGRIKVNGALIKPDLNEHGYLTVVAGREHAVHYLVARTWCGFIPAGYEIHHVDQNKRNNHASNLLIVTRAEHEMLHGFKFNLLPKQEPAVIDSTVTASIDENTLAIVKHMEPLIAGHVDHSPCTYIELAKRIYSEPTASQLSDVQIASMQMAYERKIGKRKSSSKGLGTFNEYYSL